MAHVALKLDTCALLCAFASLGEVTLFMIRMEFWQYF
jgi:hypothetical protein